MGRRLKQIKTNDLGESGKQVIDSLIKPLKPQKEEKLEQMRCKIEILDGTVSHRLVDSFISNINSLEKLVDSITEKYGDNVQFQITNLYDEKIVAKRLVYTGGYDKDKVDKEHFARQMDIIRKIHKLREEGKTYEEVRVKYTYLMGDSPIKKIYDSTEEQLVQNLKNMYGNQNLGKTPNTDILSNNLNTKKDNIPLEISKE